jgi:Holliday junction DNA helicase RuvB
MKNLTPECPTTLSEFVGQNSSVKLLNIAVKASQCSGNQLPHMLFTGPPGLGKTTLAKCVANTAGIKYIYTIGGILKSPKQIIELASKIAINPGVAIFIDEIHAIPPKVEELLYPMMQDFIFEGNKLPKFTMMGGTTNAGDLKKPLRDRFKYVFRLEPYDDASLEKIIKSSGALSDEAAKEIVTRSFGVPRIAKNYLAMCADQTIVNKREKVTVTDVKQVMERFGIDKEGLNKTERDILVLLYSVGSPIGLEALSIMLNVEIIDLKEIHERALMQKKFLIRTRRGRTLTELGRKYLQDNGLIKLL